MKIVVAAAAAFSLSISNTFATAQDDLFQKTAHDYVEQYLKANPEQATELGDGIVAFDCRFRRTFRRPRQ